MRSLLRPIVVNGVRTALAVGAVGRTAALVAVGLAVAVTIQLYPTTTPDLRELTSTARAVVGWAVVAALLGSAILAASAVRLPRRLADVAWLYTTPLPLWQIALVASAWHATIRVGVWLASGTIIDIASLIRTGGPGGGVGRALVGVPTIAAVSLWSGATATLRGRRTAASLLAIMGITGGITAVVAVIAATARTGSLVFGLERALPIVLADGLGGSLLGVPTLGGLLLVCGIVVASLALIRTAPGPRLREHVVLDATFWATFGPARGAPARGVRRRPSWRGGRKLVGSWAFLWFEVATYRRGRLPSWSALALVAAAVVVGRWEPGLLYLFTVAIAAAALLGSIASGASLHLRRGDLVLFPGRLPSKAAAAELPHVVATALPLGIALLAGGLAAGWRGAELLEPVGLGIAGIGLAFGLRLLATALAYPPPADGDALTLLMTTISVGVAGVVLVSAIPRAVSWLDLQLTAWTFSGVVALLGGAAWLSGLAVLRSRTVSGRA